MFQPNFERDLVEEESCENFNHSVVCVYVCVCVCECMYVLCSRDMYIQRCRHVPWHTHKRILIQTLIYVDVSIIMECNQHVPDPNKHEQTPDVLRERP